MVNKDRDITIYLNEDEGEIIVYDESNCREIANYDWFDLNKSYRLEEFIRDIMNLQNVTSYDDIQFRSFQ